MRSFARLQVCVNRLWLSAWFRVEVCVLDPLPGVCVTGGPFSWVRPATHHPALLPPPSSLSRLYALIIRTPIHPHLLWLTVCMNRAANSSGSFNEGRSDLKVRTEGSAERLLVQILWRVNRECGRDDRMMFDHVWLYLIVIIRTSSDIFCFRWNKDDGNIFIS